MDHGTGLIIVEEEKQGKRGIPFAELQKFLQAGWAELKKTSREQGLQVRRPPPPPVPRAAPVFGDPRWPNRVWPARRCIINGRQRRDLHVDSRRAA